MIKFEEVKLPLTQRNLSFGVGYYDGHIIVDDEGFIEELWLHISTWEEETDVRLDPCPRSEPFEYELFCRLRDEITAKYSIVIDEYVAEHKSSRRATVADHRNDMIWGGV